MLLPEVELSYCQTAAEKGQSILAPHRQTREMQSLKTVEFQGLYWLSFSHPSSLGLEREKVASLFCPDAEGEGCGGEGLASSGWLNWDCRGVRWRACEVLGAWCWGFTSGG